MMGRESRVNSPPPKHEVVDLSSLPGHFVPDDVPDQNEPTLSNIKLPLEYQLLR